jgi:hypothetical protein
MSPTMFVTRRFSIQYRIFAVLVSDLLTKKFIATMSGFFWCGCFVACVVSTLHILNRLYNPLCMIPGLRANQIVEFLPESPNLDRF